MLVPYKCPYCKGKIEGELSEDSRTAKCPNCGRDSAVPEAEIGPGVTIGNGYKITGMIVGGDSQGKLFLAKQAAMGRDVIIKLLPPDIAQNREKYQRFQREVKLAASLSHPNILTAYGAGEDYGAYFLIKQYKPGKTLEEVCREQGGTLSEKVALKLILPIAQALEYAWDEKKILHRNVKPENILVADDGVPMLMDLGIAKSMAQDAVNVTTVGFTVGTPEYMSPEQVRGASDLDFRSDLYCLGIVLYRVLTGTVPFAGANPMSVMQKQLNEAPMPAQFKNPDVSTECSALIDRLLAKNRDHRFAAWGEVVSDMKSILRGEKPKRRVQALAQALAQAPAQVPASDLKEAAPPPKKKPRPVREKFRSRGVTRGDVERIADEMYAGRNLRRKLLFYALSIFIPVALVGYIAHLYSTRQNRAERIENLYAAAEAYAEEHSHNFDVAISKYEEVKELAGPGADRYAMSDKAILALKIKKVLWTLKEESEALIRQDRYKAAIRLYEHYNGPFAGETAKERKRQASTIRKRSKAPRRR